MNKLDIDVAALSENLQDTYQNLLNLEELIRPHYQQPKCFQNSSTSPMATSCFSPTRSVVYTDRRHLSETSSDSSDSHRSRGAPQSHNCDRREQSDPETKVSNHVDHRIRHSRRHKRDNFQSVQGQNGQMKEPKGNTKRQRERKPHSEYLDNDECGHNIVVHSDENLLMSHFEAKTDSDAKTDYYKHFKITTKVHQPKNKTKVKLCRQKQRPLHESDGFTIPYEETAKKDRMTNEDNLVSNNTEDEHRLAKPSHLHPSNVRLPVRQRNMCSPTEVINSESPDRDRQGCRRKCPEKLKNIGRCDYYVKESTRKMVSDLSSSRKQLDAITHRSVHCSKSPHNRRKRTDSTENRKTSPQTRTRHSQTSTADLCDRNANKQSEGRLCKSSEISDRDQVHSNTANCPEETYQYQNDSEEITDRDISNLQEDTQENINCLENAIYHKKSDPKHHNVLHDNSCGDERSHNHIFQKRSVDLSRPPHQKPNQQDTNNRQFLEVAQDALLTSQRKTIDYLVKRVEELESRMLNCQSFSAGYTSIIERSRDKIVDSKNTQNISTRTAEVSDATMIHLIDKEDDLDRKETMEKLEQAVIEDQSAFPPHEDSSNQTGETNSTERQNEISASADSSHQCVINVENKRDETDAVEHVPVLDAECSNQKLEEPKLNECIGHKQNISDRITSGADCLSRKRSVSLSELKNRQSSNKNNHESPFNVNNSMLDKKKTTEVMDDINTMENEKKITECRFSSPEKYSTRIGKTAERALKNAYYNSEDALSTFEGPTVGLVESNQRAAHTLIQESIDGNIGEDGKEPIPDIKLPEYNPEDISDHGDAYQDRTTSRTLNVLDKRQIDMEAYQRRFRELEAETHRRGAVIATMSRNLVHAQSQLVVAKHRLISLEKTAQESYYASRGKSGANDSKSNKKTDVEEPEKCCCCFECDRHKIQQLSGAIKKCFQAENRWQGRLLATLQIMYGETVAASGWSVQPPCQSATVDTVELWLPWLTTELRLAAKRGGRNLVLVPPEDSQVPAEIYRLQQTVLHLMKCCRGNGAGNATEN